MRRNHNLDVLRRLLAAEVPAGTARTGLDIGCGEGETARVLSGFVAEVVGVDPDLPSIELARQQGGERITYVHGDAMTVALEPADVVTAVAVLHHLDMVEGLRRLSTLVATGGVLLVVGLARSTYPTDLLHDVAGAVLSRVRRQWETPAPKVWPPPVTYREARQLAEATLPGVRYRRDPRFRYTLAWRRAA